MKDYKSITYNVNYDKLNQSYVYVSTTPKPVDMIYDIIIERFLELGDFKEANFVINSIKEKK
jgi:hypothetical protein